MNARPQTDDRTGPSARARVGRRMGLAGRVTLVYGVVGAAWIFASDRLVEFLVRDDDLRAEVGTAKGWMFVAVSAVILFGYVASVERTRGRADRAEDSLVAEREVFAAVVEASPLPIVVLDETGRVRAWNRGAEQTFGWSADEAIGRVAPWVPEDRSEEFGDALDEVVGGREFAGLERPAVDREGRHRTVRIWSARVRSEPARIMVVLDDVTDRIAQQGELERLNRALRASSAASEAMLHATDERGLMQRVCDAAVTESGHRLAWVGLARDDARRTVMPVAWAGEGAIYLQGMDITWSDEPTGTGPTGTAIKTGRPVWVSDVEDDPAVAPWRDRWRTYGLRSSVALPLRVSDGSVLGALNVYSARPDAFHMREIELLQELADDLAFGIVGARARAEREQALAALGEREQQVRRTLESLSAGVIVVDAEGEVRSANPAALAMFGYAAGELVGTSVDALVPERVRPVHAVHRMRYLRAPRTRAMGADLDLYARRKDGSAFPVEIGLSSVEGPQGREVTAVVSDITERRAAERAALEAESRFRRFVESVEDYAIYTLDADGLITSWNQGAVRVKGFTEEQVLGQTIDVFYPPEAVAAGRHTASIDEARRQGRHEDEGWRVRADGSRFWGNVVTTSVRDASQEIVGFVKVVRDLTRRREAEDHLQRYARRLEVLREIDAGILAAASREEMSERTLDGLANLVEFDRGSVIAADPLAGTARILAVHQDEPLGPGAGEVVSYGSFDTTSEIRVFRDVDELGHVNPGLAQLAAAGITSGLLVRLQLGEGSAIGALWLCARRRDAFDEESVQEVARDVAHRLATAFTQSQLRDQVAQRAEELGILAEHRKRLLQQVVTAQEDERGRFARELHDGLGQTLTSLTLFAAELELLQADDIVRERVREFRGRVEGAVTETRAMVRDLRPDDLHAGLGPAVHQLVARLAEHGATTFDVHDDTQGRRFTELIEITCFRIVQEALSNVLRHAEAGDASVTLTIHEGLLTVVVEDDGRGFDQAIVEQGHYGLLGMRERATLAGGELLIESSTSTGTTLRLTLPADAPMPVEDRALPPDQAPRGDAS